MTLVKYTLAILLIAAAGLSGLTARPAHAAGCEKGNTGKILGGIAGGIAGGILGNKIARGKAGTIVGALVGVIAGTQIGKKLDRCQQEEVAKASKASLDTNRFGKDSQKPVIDPATGERIGTVETVRADTASTYECRVQRITVRDPATGEEMVEPIKQCRSGKNGAFEPVAA
ncbi:glycine zipper 2TM domain-containing protein [Novosphingobium sp. 1949]|uniref:17 kDa surface antigen n=1 Tax=Novosphingobium organovorum TaxID=2930092 RepID=A0ABT0BDY7_9SPHN|nr:glycine zipper 2TM domain-containing protein [Novosphingobium organovorum]MCJ2183260.1 glycine zipper 2TM domain-containing protein [Novosphingobium organovorum]